MWYTRQLQYCSAEGNWCMLMATDRKSGISSYDNQQYLHLENIYKIKHLKQNNVSIKIDWYM